MSIVQTCEGVDMKCLHSCLTCRKVFSIQGNPLQRHYTKCAMTDEEWKVFNYVRTKKRNCKRKGINWMLTEQDIEDLLSQAGITIWDVGRGKGKYCLSRYGDTGDYVLGNVAFVTQRENLQELWSRPEIREMMREKGRREYSMRKRDEYQRFV